MDQELIAFLEDRFREASRQIETLRQENSQSFEQIDGRFERLEDRVHQTQIALEGLRGDMRLLAEGIIGVGERLDLFRDEVTRDLKGVQYRLSVLEAHAENKGRDPLSIIRERYASSL